MRINMRRIVRFIVVVTVVLGAWGSLWAAGPEADVLKGAIDPFEASRQRALFLAAAGVDTDLTAEEFEADAKRGDGFARLYDKWGELSKFDRDRSRTIDWFEAQAYRQDLRQRVMSAYDSDGNRRLNGAERERASDALAKGRIPAAQVQRDDRREEGGDRPERRDDERERNRGDREERDDRRDGPPSQPQLAPQGQPQPGAPQPFNPDEMRKLVEDLRAKHDADGDGELNEEERMAFGREMGQIQRNRFFKHFDENGDGDVSEEEMREGQRKQAEQWRQQMLKDHDTNKDGEIDDGERREMEQKMRRQAEEQMDKWWAQRYDRDQDGKLSDVERAEMEDAKAEQQRRMEEGRRQFEKQLLERYDKDGDGQLSDEEREAWQKEMRERFRNGGPGGGFGPGGPPPGPDGAIRFQIGPGAAGGAIPLPPPPPNGGGGGVLFISPQPNGPGAQGAVIVVPQPQPQSQP